MKVDRILSKCKLAQSHFSMMLGFTAIMFQVNQSVESFAQNHYLPYHTDHVDVYNFLSELRVLGVVEYNPAVLPLSRKEIADMIWKADSATTLNAVQRKELNYWKQEFGKDLGTGKVHRVGKFLNRREFDEHRLKKRYDLLYFSNDLFQVTVNPSISGMGRVNTRGEFVRQQNWGGELFGRIGKGFGFYFVARDFLENPNWNGDPILSPELGGVYRRSLSVKSGIEYFDIRAGITYGWKWGQIGIVKDHLQMGSALQDQIILSKRAPSFPRLHLQLKPVKWVELTYSFGWLNSDVVDSARSYNTGNGVYRKVLHHKFIATNLVTARPWKYLTLSLGSSVIIADDNINAGHFIPIMFYTALDASFSSQSNEAGQNSQLFADLNFDLLGYGRLYGSLFIDELRISEMFNREKQRNVVSYQVGLETRPFTAWNLKAYGQYTLVRPGVYNHYIPTSTYAHAGYGLGYFLGENSDAIKVGLQFRPLAKFRVGLEYQKLRKGANHVFGNSAKNLTGAEFMAQTMAQSQLFSLSLSYEIINDVRVRLAVDHIRGFSDGTYFVYGVRQPTVADTWFSFGLNIGY